MDTVLQNSNDARLGEADSKDRGFEFKRDCSFLFGVIPDDDLRGH